jgi:hypothetical protein
MRPTKLTPEVRAKLVGLLRAGAYVTAAARAAGVSRSVVYHWMQTDQVFADEVHRARAEGEARHVASVMRAAPEDWRAAAFVLERQWPERWGPPADRPG